MTEELEQSQWFVLAILTLVDFQRRMKMKTKKSGGGNEDAKWWWCLGNLIESNSNCGPYLVRKI